MSCLVIDRVNNETVTVKTCGKLKQISVVDLVHCKIIAFIPDNDNCELLMWRVERESRANNTSLKKIWCYKKLLFVMAHIFWDQFENYTYSFVYKAKQLRSSIILVSVSRHNTMNVIWVLFMVCSIYVLFIRVFMSQPFRWCLRHFAVAHFRSGVNKINNVKRHISHTFSRMHLLFFFSFLFLLFSFAMTHKVDTILLYVMKCVVVHTHKHSARILPLFYADVTISVIEETFMSGIWNKCTLKDFLC